ncbi:sensor histidine kinase [Sporolactobacillus pectinivorans]|uniref:sensor histidine kinase n=1 Tax=Sporolactobacillus pectinivorans TaxID=1591408 RepID=UPI00138FF4CE|nr:sensor histidine kinase [Sporolactobacillus pectinivorans]
MKLFPKSTGPYPYIWALLVFPQYFYNVLQAGRLTDKLIGVGAGLILFYVFRQMYWLENWNLVFHFLLSIAVLSAVSLMSDPSMMFYGFLFVLMFGYANQTVQLVAGLGGLTIAFMMVSFLTEGNPFVFLHQFQFIVFLVEIITPVAIFIYERTKRLHHQLDDANERIVTLTKEKERNRFARDLHDTLGHTLTMIIMKSELAARLITKDRERAKKEIDEIEGISRKALQQARELVSSVRDCSLPEEMEEAKHFLEAKGVSVTIDVPERWPMLREADESMVALALREAVTNVVRHSAAGHCHIIGTEDHRKLIIEVRDDGVGMQKKNTEGNGLHTMQERMKLIGGKVAILSERRGTAIRFSLPLKKKGAGA